MADPILPLYPCHADEVTPVAQLLRTSIARDFADLHDLLPEDYPDPTTYFKGYDKAVENANNIVSSSVQIGKGMLITAHIRGIYDGLPRQIDRLGARVRRAVGLTVPVERFGITAARAARNNDEHVPLADALKTVLQNIAANKTALKAKGQTDDDTQKLQELYDDLTQDTTDHGGSVSTQKALTEDNIKTLNTLWSILQHAMADGKDEYRTSNNPKLDDYTYSEILKKLRLTRAPKVKPVPGA